MQAENRPPPSAKRIRHIAETLHDAYLLAITTNDYVEHICGLALFVDLVLGDIEGAVSELDDFSPWPGEIRTLFVAMIDAMRLD